MICKENLVETIKNINFDSLLTLGAGDINNYLPQLVDIAKTQS
jgi:UDP-N-acetylmuramate-alanine ligase